MERIRAQKQYLIHLDGDSNNCALDNLRAVTEEQLRNAAMSNLTFARFSPDRIKELNKEFKDKNEKIRILEYSMIEKNALSLEIKSFIQDILKKHTNGEN